MISTDFTPIVLISVVWPVYVPAGMTSLVYAKLLSSILLITVSVSGISLISHSFESSSMTVVVSPAVQKNASISPAFSSFVASI